MYLGVAFGRPKDHWAARGRQKVALFPIIVGKISTKAGGYSAGGMSYMTIGLTILNRSGSLSLHQIYSTCFILLYHLFMYTQLFKLRLGFLFIHFLPFFSKFCSSSVDFTGKTQEQQMSGEYH